MILLLKFSLMCCSLHLIPNLDVGPLQRLLIPVFELWTLPYGGTFFKFQLQYGQQETKLQLLVQEPLKSTKQLRLRRVRNIPFFWTLRPASTPVPISIVLTQSSYCNVLMCTSNLDFEIMPPDESYGPVLKIYKLLLSYLGKEWFCLVAVLLVYVRVFTNFVS